MTEKDRLFAELAANLGSGVVPAAKVAALFDIDEAALRRLAVEAYPVSIPEVAVGITVRQLAAAVESALACGGVPQAIEHLAASPTEVRVVRLVMDARGQALKAPGT